MNQKGAKRRICFVGPMLGSNPNWVPNPMEILAPLLEQDGYSCVLTSRIENRYLRLLDIVRSLIREKNSCDVVSLQTYSGPSFIVEDIVSWLTKFFGLPLIMYLHGGAIPDFMKRHPRWSKQVLSRADLIITPSTYLAEAISSYHFTASIIPNLLSLEQYPFRLRNAVAPRLLWMRTFYDYYNPWMAINVMRNVVQRYPDAVLTMAGQDKGLLEPIQIMAEDYGLERNVRFPGFLDVEMKKREFCSHDIFLNTTHIDNMPICLLEAGAAGLPIVSTDVGGVSHLVKHEESALLVLADDVDAMTKSIFRLIEEPEVAARLSCGGRKVAEQSDASVVIPMWQETLDSLLRNH